MPAVSHHRTREATELAEEIKQRFDRVEAVLMHAIQLAEQFNRAIEAETEAFINLRREHGI